MLPEEQARVKIDKQLNDAGWDVMSRDELSGKINWSGMRRSKRCNSKKV